MNKEQFLNALRRRLEYLPEAAWAGSLDFYAESIDDRVEDGMSEEEAVAALGSVEEVARAIESDLPLSTVVKQRVRQTREQHEARGGGGAWIVLAIVGFPVWLPLLISALAVVLSVYIVFWAVIISLGAAVLALVVSGVFFIGYAVARFMETGLSAALMSAGLAAAAFGLAMLLEEPVSALSKLLAKAAARFWRWLKRLFLGKGGAKA